MGKKVRVSHKLIKVSKDCFSSPSKKELGANFKYKREMEKEAQENKHPNYEEEKPKLEAKPQGESKEESDSEEEEMDEAQVKLWGKIDEVLKQYLLNGFQKLAVNKFIKDKVGNPKCTAVERVREWLFMKMNG